MLDYTEYEHILGMQSGAFEYGIQKEKKAHVFFNIHCNQWFTHRKNSCKEDKKKWIYIIKERNM